MNNVSERRLPASTIRLLPALILVIGLLSGCAASPETAAPAAAEPATSTRNTAPETAAVPTPAPEPAAPPEPEVNAPAAADVIGWNTATINETFGNAGLVRRDLGAEIWQYRTRDCVLLLFLYPKAEESGTSLRVDHLHVSGNPDSAACLKSVVRRHLGRGTG